MLIKVGKRGITGTTNRDGSTRSFEARSATPDKSIDQFAAVVLLLPQGCQQRTMNFLDEFVARLQGRFSEFDKTVELRQSVMHPHNSLLAFPCAGGILLWVVSGAAADVLQTKE